MRAATAPALACAAAVLAGAPSLGSQLPAQRSGPPGVAAPGGYAIAAWGTEQGMPSNIVLDVGQTRDGYLWLATYEGLVRFDGVAFRAFAEDDRPGPGARGFRTVVGDGAGGIWAASESEGVVHFDGRRWRRFTVRDGLPTHQITALLADGAGVLWVGTRQGVARINGGRVERLPAPPGARAPVVSALLRDAAGTLWIGTDGDGLLRVEGGRHTRLTTRDGLRSDRIVSLHADGDGTLWIGSYQAGVTQLRAGAVRQVATEGGGPQRVNRMLRDGAGRLWMAADNGLFVRDGERTRPVLRRDGTALAKAEALFLDAEGSLWIASRQVGLFRLREASVGTLTRRDGLPDDLVFAVDGDGAGGAWIATQGGVAHRARGVTTPHTQRTGALRDDATRDVLHDRAGNTWVASKSGLTRLRGGRAVTYGVADGLPDERVRALAEGADGTIWIGTYSGLAAWRDGRLRAYGASAGLPPGYVLSLFEDRRGTLWVGTQSAGLWRREGERFVPGPRALAAGAVFRLSEDARGTLWVGTANGVARLRDGRVTRFTLRDGLPGRAVYQALDDRAGSLWITGPWGVARLGLAGLEAAAAGRPATLAVTTLGSAEGMPAHESSSIGRAWRAPDGALWFPTPAGIAVVQPARVRSADGPPRAVVEQVVVDGVALEAHAAAAAGRAPLAVPAGARRLAFGFTAPSFVAPDQLAFRYRLDGFDADWVESGHARTAQYTGLPPGRYAFHVQARRGDGSWSEGRAVLALEIGAHWWQLRWVQAVAALLALAAVAVGVRLRVRVLARRAREAVLRELSLRDELTGLYNRRGLFERAESQVRRASSGEAGLTALFVDMDGMKGINDALGHAAGDQALRDVGELLRGTFTDGEVLARIGGDEFVVLVPHAPGADAVVATAGVRLRDAVAAHNLTAARAYQLALSVGTSRLDPEAPGGLEALLDAADRAMYARKRARGAARR